VSKRFWNGYSNVKGKVVFKSKAIDMEMQQSLKIARRRKNAATQEREKTHALMLQAQNLLAECPWIGKVKSGKLMWYIGMFGLPTIKKLAETKLSAFAFNAALVRLAQGRKDAETPETASTQEEAVPALTLGQ
jgi:hypothetical protein